MASFAGTDPLPVILARLKAHPRVLEVLPGADAISGLREAPWPHVAVTTGADGAVLSRNARLGSYGIAFAVWGDPDGRHGDAALSHVCGVIIDALLDMRDADHVPGEPVMHDVDVPQLPYPQPLTNGMRRWLFSASVTARSET